MTPPREWNAEDYADNSKAQLDWARELIDKLELRGDEDVLDIGSGDGKVTAEIAGLVPNGTVTGVDSSPSMVDFATRRYAPGGYPNLRFRHDDASALPFDQEFEAVFSNAALHWVRDHAPVLRGISRALRPGGRAVLQMGGQGNAADVVSVLDEIMSERPWAPFFREFEFPYGFHAPPDYQRWLKDTELTANEVRLVPKDMVHPGRAGLAAWIRTTWFPFTSAVPEDRAEEFISELVDRYLVRHPIDENGLVHVGMVRLEAHLVKVL